MEYRIRYRKQAKAELTECCEIYGESLRVELADWLRYLARAAAGKDDTASINVFVLLDEGLRTGGEQWKNSWRRWWSATDLEKVRALLTILAKRRPPWEFHVSFRTFSLLGSIPCQVNVFYEIDHLNEEIVITKFDELPGL